MTGLLEGLYRLGLGLDRALTRSQRLPRPVVSVGNLAVGGRGKTPFVIELARRLREAGQRPVVLTRGYGRSRREPVELRPDGLAQARSELSGDEALEIAWRARVPVLVGASRASNARRFLARGGEVSVFLLDDGFQHWALARNLDIVLLDESDRDGRLLPAGWLREPWTAIERAQIALMRGQDFVKRTRLHEPPGGWPARVRVLTTRAPDPAFAAEIERSIGPRPCVALADHAPASEVLRALQGADADAWILGPKEAVKALLPHELERFFSTGYLPGPRSLAGRSAFVLAEPVLEFRDAGFWPRLAAKIEDLHPLAEPS